MNFSYFPSNKQVPTFLQGTIGAFKRHDQAINFSANDGTNENRLSSEDVLSIVTPDLIEEGFVVETSKRKADKIRIPVHVGAD